MSFSSFIRPTLPFLPHLTLPGPRTRTFILHASILITAVEDRVSFAFARGTGEHLYCQTIMVRAR